MKFEIFKIDNSAIVSILQFLKTLDSFLKRFKKFRQIETLPKFPFVCCVNSKLRSALDGEFVVI